MIELVVLQRVSQRIGVRRHDIRFSPTIILPSRRGSMFLGNSSCGASQPRFDLLHWSQAYCCLFIVSTALGVYRY